MSKRTSIQDDETLILPPKVAKSQHTPGPWSVSKGTKHYHIEWAHGQVVMVYGINPVDNPGQAEANARLMAAAPELLEALRSASAYLAQYAKYHASQSAVAHNVISLVDAAIAKAEGKS